MIPITINITINIIINSHTNDKEVGGECRGSQTILGSSNKFNLSLQQFRTVCKIYTLSVHIQL